MNRDDEQTPIDPPEDDIRPEEQVEELEFPERGPMAPVEEQLGERQAVERAAEAGLTEASNPGGGPTMDDATPETLMPEDGSRSPLEAGEGGPADLELTTVDEREAGLGGGLDEAELGREKPLDGKPWDGEAR
jgi:hypothetical protein